MLLAFLLNYLICWNVWLTTDKRKAFTWVAPYSASTHSMLPSRSSRKFGLTQREEKLGPKFGPDESVLRGCAIYTDHDLPHGEGAGKGDRRKGDDCQLESTNSLAFVLAFTTSMITSYLGLAKNLKLGPCCILPEDKGLFSPIFLLFSSPAVSHLLARGSSCLRS